MTTTIAPSHWGNPTLPSVWIAQDEDMKAVERERLRQELREEVLRESMAVPVDIPDAPRRIRLRD